MTLVMTKLVLCCPSHTSDHRPKYDTEGSQGTWDQTTDSPGHRYQLRCFPDRCHPTLGVFTGVSSEMGTSRLACSDGCQSLQCYMTSSRAQSEHLFASAANFTNMPSPHGHLEGLRGQCHLKAGRSAEHSREQTLSPVFLSLNAGSAAYQPFCTQLPLLLNRVITGPTIAFGCHED